MVDVLAMIQSLRDRLWAQHGDVLKKEYTQDEIHMTYYAGDILARKGYKWFKGEEGACYTEKAMHAAFIAGLRVGKREAQEIADRIVEDRMSRAAALLETGIGY